MAQPLVERSSNVSDAVVRKHIRAVSAAKEAVDSANGAYRAALKAAKTDGVNQGALTAALADRRKDEPQVILNLRDRVRYLALLNFPTEQLDMFAGTALQATAEPDPDADDAADRREHDLWLAREDGQSAGRAGRLRDANPHDTGSESHQAWDSGYMTGQGAIAAELGDNARAASTRRRRRADA